MAKRASSRRTSRARKSQRTKKRASGKKNPWIAFVLKVHGDNKKKHGSDYPYKKSIADAADLYRK